MTACFVDSFRNLEGFQLDFDQFPATIGRAEHATVRLTDRWLSRLHCQIEIEGEHLVVRDLDSRHGTSINGEQVEEATLAPGDELQIGMHTYRVQYARAELLCQTSHMHSEDSSVATMV